MLNQYQADGELVLQLSIDIPLLKKKTIPPRACNRTRFAGWWLMSCVISIALSQVVKTLQTDELILQFCVLLPDSYSGRSQDVMQKTINHKMRDYLLVCFGNIEANGTESLDTEWHFRVQPDIHMLLVSMRRAPWKLFLQHQDYIATL